MERRRYVVRLKTDSLVLKGHKAAKTLEELIFIDEILNVIVQRLTRIVGNLFKILWLSGLLIVAIKYLIYLIAHRF